MEFPRVSLRRRAAYAGFAAAGPLGRMLSSQEREAVIDEVLERRDASSVVDDKDRDAHVRRLRHAFYLTPALPDFGPRCSLCRVPTSTVEAPCGDCRKLLDVHGPVVDSLESITMMSSDVPAYRAWADWKAAEHGDGRLSRLPQDDSRIDAAAVALSAYCEDHNQRLLADSPMVTMVATSAPLIAVAFERAASRGWFALHLVESGVKRGAWRQKESRAERAPADWQVHRDLVSDRAVLLFDDFMSSGQSLFSYARALRDAGASEVRAVILQRMVKRDYYTVVAWLRRRHALEWDPARAEVALLAAAAGGRA